MEECTFCKIVKGEIPVHKIFEDDDHLVFLDIFPNTKGVTLVITKKHYTSYAFDLPDDVYSKLFLLAKKIGKILDKSLGSVRTFMVTEGMEISHIHIKLYPFYKIARNVAPPEIDHVQYTEYPGYITTLHGPRADDEELGKIAAKVSKEASKLK
ncbi:MAG: HIT family protein [Candidatus Aenigmatarchaeota archaeon]